MGKEKQQFRIKSGKHTRGQKDDDGNIIWFQKGHILPDVTVREFQTIGDKLEPVVASAPEQVSAMDAAQKQEAERLAEQEYVAAEAAEAADKRAAKEEAIKAPKEKEKDK